eukprot:Gb_12751 [translate_table: standard]
MHDLGNPTWKSSSANPFRRKEPSRVVIIGYVLLVIIGTAVSSSSVSVDGNALLEFRKLITRDPFQVLLNWNESDKEPCSWTGVTCNPVSRRVMALNISGRSDCGSRNLFSSAVMRGDNSSAAPCSRLLHITTPATESSESCSVRGIIPESYTAEKDAGGSVICLRNGSTVNTSATYRGRDQVSCKLTGKLSPFIGNLTELRILSLPFNAFSGPIPKEIGNLRFLEVLELQGNSLAGHLPSELSNLSSLHVLDLGYNALVGGVPKEISDCHKLETLDLAGNMLNGTIPTFLGGFPKLKVLSLSFNQFSGPIPLELANNCGSLEYLHLSGNLLIEEIPPQLGNCTRLRSLSLFSNFLDGSIPPDIGKLSMLQTLDVSRNSLSGNIPKELANCRQLSVLVLSNLLDYAPGGNYTDIDPSNEFSNSDKGEYNYFEGDIPADIFTLPQLQIIWAPRASLNGPLPEDWGNCSNLQIVNLGQNLLTGQIPAGLVKCKSIFFLDLSSNHLRGGIPELPISCMSYFNVSGNSLTGNVPTVITSECPKQPLFPTNQYGEGVLDVSQAQVNPSFIYATLFYCGTCASSSLAYLVSEGLPVFHDLSRNNFTGSIPPTLIGYQLMEEQPAYGLLLNHNQLSGNISSSLFASCQSLQSFVLNLSANQISGEIPAQLFVNCKSLKQLEAAANQITGSIPSTLGNLESLLYLDLSKNNLQGSIPTQFGQLMNLQYLALAENNITGEIPGVLGQLSSIVVLKLSSNGLTGKIPEGLANLRQLRNLLLDKNKLSGQIPEGFANLSALTVFNVSFNNLSGPIPQLGNSMTCESFTGNPLLHCHSTFLSVQQPGQPGVPLPNALAPAINPVEKHGQFNSIEIAAITSASAIVFVLLVLVVLFQFRTCRIPISSGHRSGRREVITFTNIGVQLTYENVVRATGNFSAANFIGNGGFGATYKAELTPGLLVAVKRLSVGRFQGIQQFDAEIRTLGRVRHSHLVTLIGYHASESEMFLVYNYLPGGNLERFLRERSNRNVDWCMLHKIALDIARALAYLHDECVPRVLHRDIKPSNILLDNHFNAYLSDFGLARLLGTSETHATTDVAGTFGYVAPEYAMTCRVSDKADVYSYGVVLLELLSDKKALDPSFSSYGNGFNIVAWACMLLRQGKARELFTAGLWDVGPHDDLVETLHLAVMCTVDSLSIRPSMKQVVQRLKQLQPPLR